MKKLLLALLIVLVACTHKYDSKIIKMADGNFYKLESAIANESYQLVLIDTSEINKLK